MPTWLIVWFAPQHQSSGGRSPVKMMRGTPVKKASTVAGRKLAAAVPEVQTSATGSPKALAIPRAKKPAERSSRCIQDWIDGFSAKAIVNGVDRDPGQIHTCLSPQRDSSSTKVLVNA